MKTNSTQYIKAITLREKSINTRMRVVFLTLLSVACQAVATFPRSPNLDPLERRLEHARKLLREAPLVDGWVASVSVAG